MVEPNLTRTDAERRAQLLRVTSYDVALDLTDGGGKPGDRTFASRTVARFTCSEPGAGTFVDVIAAGFREVTLNGRRISVSVLTRRERLLADAASVERTHAGPTIVKATLPGLIVTVTVEVGDEIAEGATLLTIEAMKMQNEVRAPRAGKVIEVTVAAGQVVATGASLLRLE